MSYVYLLKVRQKKKIVTIIKHKIPFKTSSPKNLKMFIVITLLYMCTLQITWRRWSTCWTYQVQRASFHYGRLTLQKREALMKPLKVALEFSTWPPPLTSSPKILRYTHQFIIFEFRFSVEFSFFLTVSSKYTDIDRLQNTLIYTDFYV